MGTRLIDLSGQVFNRLTVIKCAGQNKRREYLWHCKCECGKDKITTSYHLKSGKCRSCGCAAGTHHKCRTPEYRTWNGMVNRCHNTKNGSYHRYGARGISVCDSWRWSFENFLKDMGEKPADEYSIDRVDNEGDYTKENCRWATKREQANNRRSSYNITHDGVTLTQIQWARRLKINQPTLSRWLKNGMSFKDVIAHIST